ncbi:MAG: PEP-CTERM sorting domain-containing protein [Desulfobacterales bacterium]|nr:PEP-CTERM sorting domain-containing protein [Desulfobacterales bacterium]
MLRTANRILIFTLLMVGVLLSGSAFAALGTITAGGVFNYNGSTGTLIITDATVVSSDFDVLISTDKITLTSTLGSSSSNTIHFNGSDVIEAVAAGSTNQQYLNNSILLFGRYSITGGDWSQYFKTDFSSQILLTLGDGQSFSGYDADYTGSAQIHLSLTSVPVPSSLTLMGLGLLIFAGYLRRICGIYSLQVFKS